jgi:hypothetical protein
MYGVALTRVSEMGLDRGDDPTRVADRPGEDRAVTIDHAGERAADRGGRIGADVAEVVEVRQHDDDRAQDEGRHHRECRDRCATQLVADSLHVAECARRQSMTAIASTSIR